MVLNPSASSAYVSQATISPPIHHTNTSNLSLLLESMPADHQANRAVKLDYFGSSPPAYGNYPTPKQPPWSPLTPLPIHAPPPPPTFQPEPVDKDALLQHNPFLLAEGYGGKHVTDRTTLFWIEGNRLPSLRDIGLDPYTRLEKAGERRGRDFWHVVL